MCRNVLLFLVLFCPTFIIARSCQKDTTAENYCYSTDENPYLFFSTKTAYHYNHGNLNEDVVPESNITYSLVLF